MTALLRREHQRTARLFERLQATGDAAVKQQVFEELRRDLESHAAREEALFYPALEEAGDPDLALLVREARREHRTVSGLLAEAAGRPAGSPEHDALVAAVRGAVEHHVEREESGMMPRAREVLGAARLVALGRRLAASVVLRREGLRQEAGAARSPPEAGPASPRGPAGEGRSA